MQRVKAQSRKGEAESPMGSSVADCPVVALKALKRVGAKGAAHSVYSFSQPRKRKEDDERNNIKIPARHESDGLERLPKGKGKWRECGY